ncbi:MAG: PTS sugar transporter subunit IIA [Planctomycetes bacterium]|nr:PTS sugar transporter subunit IIA [Planctomycetota bacterium]
MLLSELLRPEAVLLGVRDVDKWQVIDHLTRLLVAAGRLPGAECPSVLEALVARERSMSTGMENGVAIPHCSMEQVNDTLVSLGVSREGIDFESIDEKPARLILLLVTPKNKTKVHIRTLAEIAKLLNDADFRGRLVAAETPQEVLDLIRRRESAEGLG